MITKRQVAGVQERINSAINELRKLSSETKEYAFSFSRIDEILERDLEEARDQLDYMFLVAD